MPKKEPESLNTVKYNGHTARIQHREGASGNSDHGEINTVTF